MSFAPERDMAWRRELILASVTAVTIASASARADDPSPESIPHLGDGEHFMIDPVVDGVLIAGGVGFTCLLGLVLSTGEIQPVPPGDPDKLLSIDRIAVTQTIDPNAGLYSDIGIYTAYGYALLDPILSGVRNGRRAALVDAIMYGESLALTQAFTLATKIGVRRPRPVDYLNCGGTPPPETATLPTCSSLSSRVTRRRRAQSARPPRTSRSCAAVPGKRGRGSRSRRAHC